MKRVICLFLLSAALLPAARTSAQVAVNPSGSAPDPSAGLDVSFSDKGILVPRVNALGAVASPASGLLVYLTTDNSFYTNRGTPASPNWARLVHTPATGTVDMSGQVLTGVPAPVNNSDAVNKAYVDNAVAGSGGGGPTMISAESATTLATFGDAVRYCKNLSEGGYTDWYLPTFQQLVSIISKGGSSVSAETSTNYIWTAFSDAFDGSNNQYRYMGYRLSDGHGRRNWNSTASHVRCVR